jgi:hypothetical protein
MLHCTLDKRNVCIMACKHHFHLPLLLLWVCLVLRQCMLAGALLLGLLLPGRPLLLLLEAWDASLLVLHP